MLQRLRTIDPSWQLLIAIAGAMLLGAFCMAFRAENALWVNGFADACASIGIVFVWALKAIVAPLVFISIVIGVGKLRGLKYDPVFASRAFAYYAVVGFLAIILTMVLMHLLVADPIVPDGATPAGFGAVLRWMIPTGLFAAAEDPNQLLGIVFVAGLLGVVLACLPQTLRTQQLAFWVRTLNFLTRGADLLVKLAPLGVFGLVFPRVLGTGPALFFPVGKFFLLVVLAFGIHAFLTLGFLAWVASRGRAKQVFETLAPAVWTALSTGSVVMTVAVTLRLVKKDLGVPRAIARQMVPLGVRMNTDGAALYECLVVLFFAQIYAMVDPSYLTTFSGQWALALIAQVAALALVGIPSASLLTITVMVWLVGLPVEAIGIILVADRVMDRMRIAVNALSTGIGALLVTRSIPVGYVLKDEEYATTESP